MVDEIKMASAAALHWNTTVRYFAATYYFSQSDGRFHNKEPDIGSPLNRNTQAAAVVGKLSLNWRNPDNHSVHILCNNSRRTSSLEARIFPFERNHSFQTISLFVMDDTLIQ